MPRIYVPSLYEARKFYPSNDTLEHEGKQRNQVSMQRWCQRLSERERMALPHQTVGDGMRVSSAVTIDNRNTLKNPYQ